ncbi:MAG: YqiJ family protein [Alphaproteobacteria bacterium]|nr:YqiJ family protein [Alphaproteobacteria bacterium]
MLEHILADQTAPFAVALGLMLLIALVEGVGMLFGLGISNLVDSLLPDVEVPDIDADVDLDTDLSVHAPDLDAPSAITAPNAGLFTQLLTWICFGRVPALVLLIAFLTAFGISGLVIQSLIAGMFGHYLPAIVATVPALLIAFPSTRYIGLGLSKVIPKEETEAVSKERFIGKIAVIIRGEAKRGLPAEAKLKDRYGLTHYVLLEPDRDDELLTSGSEVLIVRQVGAHFRAIENTSASLSNRENKE